MVALPDVWRRLEAEVVGWPLVGDESGLIPKAEATEPDTVGSEGMVPRSFC